MMAVFVHHSTNYDAFLPGIVRDIGDLRNVRRIASLNDVTGELNVSSQRYVSSYKTKGESYF